MPKRRGRHLLTPRIRHVDAFQGALSVRPDGGALERCPWSEISTFRCGQQPKLRELFGKLFSGRCARLNEAHVSQRACGRQ